MFGWIKRRKWWVLGAIMVAVALGAWYMRGRGKEEPVETMTVERTTVRDEVDVTGTVEPVERYDLSFSAAGVLTALEVKEGEEVLAGQVLARVEASDASWQEAQAKAVLVGDQETARLALAKEKADLVDLKALHAAQLEEYKQNVRNTKASLDTAREQFQRIKENDTDESSVVYTASESAYTTALNSYQAAQDSLTVLKKTVVQAEAGAEADIVAAENTLRLKGGVINNSGDVSVNAAGLRYQQALLGKTVMTAPADGVVAKIEGSLGEYVSPTTPVFTLVSKGFQLAANVPETEAAKFSVGDRAAVTFDAFRDEGFKAQVAEIDTIETVIEGVTTYRTTFVFEGQDERLRSGMTADAVVLVNEKEQVLAVPQRAVYGGPGQRAVDVMRGENREKVMVETGMRSSEGMVEILTGLKEGDIVVTFDPNAEK